jgi:sucrose phosphorylase
MNDADEAQSDAPGTTGSGIALQESGQSASHADGFRVRLSELLSHLYSADEAERLAVRLLAHVPKAPRPHVTKRNPCMLITYADTIRAEGEAPLKTLHRFLKLHVADTFGAVHILPFYPSSSDDGFAVIDYRLVDHHFGNWEDIAAIADDYELMFDLVINHCSRESLWFADFVSGRDPGRNYFITLPEESDTSAVVRPRSTPLISAVHTYAGIRHVWNTFSDDQIDLDFSNPAVLEEFVDILFFYLERGARLVRLDAIGFLWKRLGTSCMNLPEVHTVVKILRLLLEAAGSDGRLVSETNVPHEENVSYLGNGDEAHMVYQFSLAPLLLYSYAFGDASYLTTWAARLESAPAGTTFLNFIASHDGIGLRPLEGLVPDQNVTRLVELMHRRGGFVTMRQISDQEQKPYEINISLFSAFGGEEGGSEAYLGAHLVLLSFQGVPALYIHSLLASGNDLNLVEQTGRTRSINRGSLSLAELDQQLADSNSLPSRVLSALRAAIACRNAQPAFASSAEQSVSPSPPGVFVMRRQCPAQTITVVASMLPEPQSLMLTGMELPPGSYTDLLTEELIEVSAELQLQPFQVLWLVDQPAAAL